MHEIEIPKVCRYCGSEVVFTSNEEIYGKQYGGGKCYLCRNCGAYVGTHQGSKAPLGTLADEDLRQWRRKAHDIFDEVWKKAKISRPQAYSWLSKQMGLPFEKTHIAMFEIEQCKKVIEIITKEKGKTNEY